MIFHLKLGRCLASIFQGVLAPPPPTARCALDRGCHSAQVLQFHRKTALEDGEIIIYLAIPCSACAPTILYIIYYIISDLLHVEDSLTQVLRSISLQNPDVFHVNHALVSSET